MRALRGECHKFGQEIDFDKRGILAEDAQTGISITNRYSSFGYLQEEAQEFSQETKKDTFNLRVRRCGQNVFLGNQMKGPGGV